MKSTMIGFRVSESVNNQLKELADKQGVTISAYVKAKVEDFVNKTEGTFNTLNKFDPIRPNEDRLTKAREVLEGAVNTETDATVSQSSPKKTLINTIAPLGIDLSTHFAEESKMIDAMRKVNPVPLYNPLAPQTGEKVRMPSGEIITVPELDADGEPIETGSTGRLVSDNVFKPTFLPDPKPEKKEKKGRYARV